MTDERKLFGIVESLTYRNAELEAEVERLRGNNKQILEILEDYDWEEDLRNFIWTPDGQAILKLLQGDE